MKSTAHAQANARQLADTLSVRTKGSATIDTVRQATDANGWPMLFLSKAGNEAAGQPVIAIRISNPDAGSKDIFGNATSAYTPHTLELAYEISATDNPVPADVDLIVAVYQTSLTGIKLQVKEIATGTAVTEASMNAAAVKLEIEDLYWPTKGV